MATSTLPSFTNSTTADAADIENFKSSIVGDIVPMDAAGTFTGDTFNLGTTTAHWENVFCNSITIASQSIADFIKETAVFDAIGTEEVLSGATASAAVLLNQFFTTDLAAKLIRVSISGQFNSGAPNLTITVSDNVVSESRSWSRASGDGTSTNVGFEHAVLFNDWFNISEMSATVTVLVGTSPTGVFSGTTRVFRNAVFGTKG